MASSTRLVATVFGATVLARLPAEYDVVIFLDQTTASVLLPFNYPRSF